MRPAFFLLIFTFCLALNIGAQERTARIYHGEGVDFAITLRGERVVFAAGGIFREGINLERSAMIHTGQDTTLEIQLIPSGTIIKVSENTSLVYSGFDESGNFTELGLLYGRIRIVTGLYSPSASRFIPTVIRGGGVSVRVDTGDLGIDYTVEPGIRFANPRPLFRVYALRGNAEIYPYGRDGLSAYFGGAQALALNSGESLTFDVSPPYTYAERKSLDSELIYYWRSNNFTGTSPLPMPETGIADVTESPVIVYLAPPPAQTVTSAATQATAPRTIPEQIVITRNRQKNLALAIGLSLTLGSVGAQLIANQFDTSTNTAADKVYTAAYATLGLGVAVTLAGILFSPLPSR